MFFLVFGVCAAEFPAYSGQFVTALQLKNGLFQVSNSLFSCSQGAIAADGCNLSLSAVVFFRTTVSPALSVSGGNFVRGSELCFYRCTADGADISMSSLVELNSTSFIRTTGGLLVEQAPVFSVKFNQTSCDRNDRDGVCVLTDSPQIDMREVIAEYWTRNAFVIDSAWTALFSRGLFICNVDYYNTFRVIMCSLEVRELVFRGENHAMFDVDLVNASVACFDCWSSSFFSSLIATYNCFAHSNTNYPVPGDVAKCGEPWNQKCLATEEWDDTYRDGPVKSGLVLGGLAVGFTLLLIVTMVVFVIVIRYCCDFVSGFGLYHQEKERWEVVCELAVSPNPGVKTTCRYAEIVNIELEDAANRARHKDTRAQEQHRRKQERNEEWTNLVGKPAEKAKTVTTSDDESSEFAFEHVKGKKKKEEKQPPPQSLIVPEEEILFLTRTTQKRKPPPADLGSDSDSGTESDGKPTFTLKTDTIRMPEPKPVVVAKKEKSESDSWSDLSVGDVSDWSTDGVKSGDDSSF